MAEKYRSEPKTYFTKLANDLSILTEATESTIERLGDLGSSGNKTWTLFARAASGSFWWRLQARLRVFSNAAELWSDRNKKMYKAMIENIDLEAKFAKASARTFKTTEDLEALHDSIMRGDALPEWLEKNDIFSNLIDSGKTKIDAYKKTLDLYRFAQESFQKQIDIQEAGGIFKYLTGKGTKNLKQFAKNFKPIIRGVKLPGGGQTLKKSTIAAEKGKAIFKEVGNTIGDAVKAPLAVFRRLRLGKKGGGVFNPKSKIGKKMGDNWKLIGSNIEKMKKGWGKLNMKTFKAFLDKGLLALKGALMWGFALVIAALFFFQIMKKFVPIMLVFLKKIGVFKFMAQGIFNMLTGIMQILTGLWEGDLWKVLKGLANLFIFGIGQVLVSALAGIVAAILAFVPIMVMSIFLAMHTILKKLPIVGKYFASGGITPGGPIVVGEKGPEIVSPPRGSRVHSNADSRGMGGNTIHVHINGRLGASDAEIRDIANKVAREINLRMNRTGTATLGV